MKMTGNTMLISGGTSGLGLGLALRFHEAGNTVIVAGRRTDRLDAIAAEHGIDGVVLDVADPASIAACVDTVTARYPQLNVLVNMAGIMVPEDVLDPGSLAVAESTVATNLLGPIRMQTALLPFLTAKEDAVVMNVSSGLAFVPLPFTPTYCATKAAIHSYTESLRVQLAGTPVQVIELIPPHVRTALLGSEDDERAMPLDEFLSEAMALLEARPDAGYVMVERVKRQRFAEVDGAYDAVLALQSSGG